MCLTRSLALLLLAAASASASASMASASLMAALAWSHERPLPRASVWTHDAFPAVDDALPPTHRKGVVDVRVLNQMNILDYVKVDMGTPPQRVRLELVLEDFPTWLVAVPWGHHRVYNHSQSSTFDASASGAAISMDGVRMTVAKDRATIGGVSSLASDWVFAELTDVAQLPHGWEQVPMDGFLSLGVPASGMPAIVPSLVRAGVLAEPVVALALRKNANGVLSLGGVNPQLFRGEITYIDTAADAKRAWAVPFSGIDVTGTGHQLEGGKLAFFGGLASTKGTPRAVAAAMKAIEAIAGPCDVMQSVLHVCSCAKLPSLTFHVGDGAQKATLTLPAADYSTRIGPDKCIVDLFPAPALESMSVDWVVGREALTHRYVVFDYGNDSRRPRVGFATRA